MLYTLSGLQTTPLFCLIDLCSFAPSLLSDTLERQTQSPSVYGTTRRSTKSRVQDSWAASASCPTPSTDSKILAVSTRLCLSVYISAYSVSLNTHSGHWCVVSILSLCDLTVAFTLRCQSGFLVKGDREAPGNTG